VNAHGKIVEGLARITMLLLVNMHHCGRHRSTFHVRSG
jgi:hypothetical protein